MTISCVISLWCQTCQAIDQVEHKEAPLVINGNFEDLPLSWNFVVNKNSKAYTCPGKDGKALCLESANIFGRAVASQKLNLEQKSPVPLVMRGWSRIMSCDSGTNMVKVISWYDNEWGYSSRVSDLATFIGSKL